MGKFRYCFLLSIAFTGTLYAGVVQTAATTINWAAAFSQYGGGDIVLKVVNPVAGCEDGFWISKSDPGFNANASFVLTAFQMKTKVQIAGNDGQIWAGSSDKYCRLHSVTVVAD